MDLNNISDKEMLDFLKSQVDNDFVKETKEKLVKLKRKQYLDKHASFASIWQGSDGRWKTRVPDTSGGRRMIARKNKKDLLQTYIESVIRGIYSCLFSLMFLLYGFLLLLFFVSRNS